MIAPTPSTPITPTLAIVRKSQPFFQARMPLPPSVNGAYQVIVNHRTGEYRLGPTSALTKFKEEAALELMLATVNRPLLDAIRASKRNVPMVVELRVYYRTLWKRDLDGPEKFAVDAAFEHLGLNDTCVVDKHTTKQIDTTDPRVEIEIYCELQAR